MGKFKQILQNVICQATKLNKKQAALTDPKQIQAQIQKWQKAAKGQVTDKDGKKLNPKYCKQKIALFNKKLEQINNGSASSEESSGDSSATAEQQSPKKEQKKDQQTNETDNDKKVSKSILKKSYDSLSDEQKKVFNKFVTKKDRQIIFK